MSAELSPPFRFADVKGQPHVVSVLSGMVSKGVVFPSLLFSGGSGVGKDHTARALANELEGLLIDIEPSIDGLRILERELTYAYDMWRVFTISNVDVLTAEAVSLLARIIPQLPKQCVLIQSTNNLHDVSLSLRSRSMEFGFRPLGQSAIAQILPDLPENAVRIIASRANGDARQALILAENFSENSAPQVTVLDLLQAATNGDTTSVVHVASELADYLGNSELVIRDLTKALADLLVVKSGGTILEQDKTKHDLALKLDPARIIAALKILWEASSRVASEPNSAQVVSVLVAEALTPSAPKNVVASPSEPINGQRVNADRPMSLEEMMKKIGS